MVDRKEIILCPACNEEMEKVFVEAANVYVDICSNGCGGIYFDNNELSKFDEAHEDISEITQILENKTFKSADMEKERLCPHCGQKMVKNFTSFSKEIATDDCYNCGGKFLDYGELEKLRQQYETESERIEANREKIFESPLIIDEIKGNSHKEYKKSYIKKTYDSIFRKIFSKLY